ncbi:hypothetical protein BH09BAC1_BH09BAC1_15690 [soil metagenome]
MHILVINSGSSSVKADIIDSVTGEQLCTAVVERIKSENPHLIINGEDVADCPAGHGAAIPFLLDRLLANSSKQPIEAVGHRVVHGGEHFTQATLVTDEVLATCERLNHLAPLHNPVNLEGIYIARLVLPDVPHVAVFDTAFHHTLPKRAQAYALPKKLTEKYAIRRYGFHGTSHEYVAHKAADYLKANIGQLRIITCHLGNGCSVTAVEFGRSVETSMGMTPLEGLVMGTRSGDVDPGVLVMLAKEESLDAQGLDQLLNHESGLLGITGIGNDMRDIIEQASGDNEDARLAIHVFSHRLRKYIGAYAAVMGGVDAIVFTGGIGENSSVIRHRVSQRLDYLGAVIDEDLNRDLRLSKGKPAAEFSMPHSRVKMLAIKTDEQFSIARQTAQVAAEMNKVNRISVIPVAVSARHVHLKQETVELLFGPGYHLTERAPLSQPGQFSCNETVTVVGPKNRIERVRILGPVRPENQVEISRTDEFFLGIDAPVRESGKIENTPGCTLIGPYGEVAIQNGVICAWRHIHMTPQDAENFGVSDKDIVELRIANNDRSLTFGNVLVRVSPKYKLEMHIDTDEGNAADLSPGAQGVLIYTEGSASLITRQLKVGEVV